MGTCKADPGHKSFIKLTAAFASSPLAVSNIPNGVSKNWRVTVYTPKFGLPRDPEMTVFGGRDLLLIIYIHSDPRPNL